MKILEGKNLLVSDLLTGTSDPMALLWVGSCDEDEVDLKYDKRVQVPMILLANINMWFILQRSGFVSGIVEQYGMYSRTVRKPGVAELPLIRLPTYM